MRHIIIVGAGLSGLSAAISAAENGASCSLVSLQDSERAQSVLAEGGINAALDVMGEHDVWQEHFTDTMRGGVDLADPNAVEGLTRGAPDVVRRLAALGVPFQMESGHIIQRNFGGQKKKRTAYAKSSTGKVLMTALIDAARRYEAQGLIRRYSRHSICGLTMNQNGECTGATVRDEYTGAFHALRGSVILCSGGLNGFFRGRTTGTTQNTGDATAIAFAQGAALANLEFIQYHPTTIGISGKRCLISEAARGEGGRLFIYRGTEKWYFMEELYPELGNLMPRDVVSREMTRVTRLPDCGKQVYLDMTGLPEHTWQKKLPDLREECIHYLGLDPAAEPIPVEPGIHFFMGGLYVDELHRTTITGLYAAGECACQYHGANRLGGNSMLAAIYSGRLAAETTLKAPEPDSKATGTETRFVRSRETDRLDVRLTQILSGSLGILRDAPSLDRAAAELTSMLEEKEWKPLEQARLRLAIAIVLSARHRKESRGAHTRTDYPDRSEACRRTTAASLNGGSIEIEYRAIPERR